MDTSTATKNTKRDRKSQPKALPGYTASRLLKRQYDIIMNHLAKIHEQKPEVTKQDLLNDIIDDGIHCLIIAPRLVEAAKSNGDQSPTHQST